MFLIKVSFEIFAFVEEVLIENQFVWSSVENPKAPEILNWALEIESSPFWIIFLGNYRLDFLHEGLSRRFSTNR